jgi:hypothetical protein
MTSLRTTAVRVLRIPLIASVMAVSAGVALAAPASALPCRTCGGDPVPPPTPRPVVNNPFGSLDGAQQTTSLNAVHVTGWAADADAASASLTVRITVDGTVVTSATANSYRPDVANAYAGYGAYHGYDVVVPASNAAHSICVIAVNVGSGQDKTLGCRTEDTVTGFTGSTFVYDTAHALITGTTLDELDHLSQSNYTTVTQSTEMDGSRTLTDTSGWTDTQGVKVTVSAGVSVGAIFVDSKMNVSVEGSLTFAQNGSSAVAQQFSWRQPIVVPAHSRVDADVAVSRSTVTVPYTISGNFQYVSGASVPGSVSGTYNGISSHDLIATTHQYDLNGNPMLGAAQQPAAHLSVAR